MQRVGYVSGSLCGEVNLAGRLGDAALPSLGEATLPIVLMY